MEVMADLFNDLTGILALGVVLFVIGMAIYLFFWFKNKAFSEE